MDATQAFSRTKLDPRPYQLRIVGKNIDMFRGEHVSRNGNKQAAAKSVLIESPTGCLTGDTVVSVNVGGKGFRVTLAEAFVRFHGGDPDAISGSCFCGCGGQTRVPRKTDRSKNQSAGVPLRFIHGHQSRVQRWCGSVRVRAYKGERGIGLQPVANIIRSGLKQVFLLALDNGMVLRGTGCHPVLTVDGFIPIGGLERGMVVLVDKVTPQPSTNHTAKVRDGFICNLWNHPYGRRVRTTKETCGFTIRVPLHVAIYEAYVNGLAISDYVTMCRHGDPTTLALVDPATHVVHHRDGDHGNNDSGNLEAKTAYQHNYDHGVESHYLNFGNATPTTAKVVSVEPVGEAMTYDICCEQPYHTFVANGIIVHNSGKTPIGLVSAKIMQDLFGCSVGWVAMRRNLLAQAGEMNALHGINVDMKLVSMFDKRPPKMDFMVVDESQHDAANSMAHIHAVSKPQWVLGLTATPFRTDRVKLCFDQVIKDAGIKALITDGYLSQYHHYSVPTWSPETVAEHYLRCPERWGKSAAFWRTIKESEEFAGILLRAGVRVEVVTGDSDREAQLERFHSGETLVISNCMVLTEGFDCPDLKTVFVRDSVRGPTIQMCLDTSTEILTKDGWKTHKTISKEDIAAGFDQETGAIEWVPVDEIVSRPIAVGESFIVANNQHLDVRVTDQHDLLYRSRSKHDRRWIKAAASDLFNLRQQPFQIPTAGSMPSLGVELSNDELRLLGLYLTDGSYYRSTLTVPQSVASDQLPAIENAFAACGLRPWRSQTKRKGRLEKYPDKVVYGVGKLQLQSLRLVPFMQAGKLACLDLLEEITPDQLAHLLVGMQIGDGKKRRTVDDYTPRTFALCLGNDYAFIDKFQSLCVRKLFSCNLGYYSYPPNEWNKLGEHGAIAYVKRVSHRTVCGSTPIISSLSDDSDRCRLVPDVPLPDEIVWCISNRLGTIVTRRNGKVVIMGNCGRVFRKHPSQPFKQVVQSQHTKWPMLRTALPARQFLWQSDEWRGLQVNEKIDLMNTNTRLAIATVQNVMPAFILKGVTKKRKATRLSF